MEDLATELHRISFLESNGNLFLPSSWRDNPVLLLRDDPHTSIKYISHYFSPGYHGELSIWLRFHRIYMSIPLSPIEFITLRNSAACPEDQLSSHEIPLRLFSNASSSKTMKKKLVSPIFNGEFSLDHYELWCAKFDQKMILSVTGIIARRDEHSAGEDGFYDWFLAAQAAFMSISNLRVPLYMNSYNERMLEINFNKLVLEPLVTYLNSTGLLPPNTYFEISSGNQSKENQKSRSDIYISLVRFESPELKESSTASPHYQSHYKSNETIGLYESKQSIIILFFEMKAKNLRGLVKLEIIQSVFKTIRFFTFDLSHPQLVRILMAHLRQTTYYEINDRLKFCFLSDSEFTFFFFLDLTNDESGLNYFKSTSDVFCFANLSGNFGDRSKTCPLPLRYLIFQDGIYYSKNGQMHTLQSFISYLLFERAATILGDKHETLPAVGRAPNLIIPDLELDDHMFSLLRERFIRLSDQSRPNSNPSSANSTSGRSSHTQVVGESGSVPGHIGQNRYDNHSRPFNYHSHGGQLPENAVEGESKGPDTHASSGEFTDECSANTNWATTLTTSGTVQSSAPDSINPLTSVDATSLFTSLLDTFDGSSVEIYKSSDTANEPPSEHIHFIHMKDHFSQFDTVKLKLRPLLQHCPHLKDSCLYPERLNDEYVIMKMANQIDLKEQFEEYSESFIKEKYNCSSLEELINTTTEKLKFEILITKLINKYNDDFCTTEDEKVNVPRVLWHGYIDLSSKDYGLVMIAEYIEPDLSIYDDSLSEIFVNLSEEQGEDCYRQLNILHKRLGISHNDLEEGHNLIFSRGKMHFIDFAEASICGLGARYEKNFNPDADNSSIRGIVEQWI